MGDSTSTRGEGGSLDGPAIAFRLVVMAEDAEGLLFTSQMCFVATVVRAFRVFSGVGTEGDCVEAILR